VAGPGAKAEVEERVTRMVGTDGAWSAVIWSDLTEADADAVIAGQVARSAGPFEWKYYSHDRPADLPERLRAAGLRPEPAETVMVAELADLELPVAVPQGVHVVTVEDPVGVETMVGVHVDVFGDVHPGTREAVRQALGQRPRPIEAVIAWAGDVAVAAGRVEFHEGTEFASLWGGGTLPAWRGRGVFRAVVGYRATLARERGFRYLQVDAMPASRPILERMGFHPLVETTPWMYGGGAG
jgi:GNAT superfamily N-acetyltransferase